LAPFGCATSAGCRDLREDLLASLLDLEDQGLSGGMVGAGGEPFESLEARLCRPQNDDRIDLTRHQSEDPPRIGQVGTVDTEPGSAGVECVGRGRGHS
jgi:hypothetical protein